MTTIYQNFSGESNVSPFTAFDAEVEIVSGAFRIIGGVLTPASQDSSSIIRMVQVPTDGVMRIDFASSNTEAMYGDNTSAMFIDAAGNGWAAILEGDRFYFRPVVAYDVSGYIMHTAGNVYSAGESFSVTYDLATDVLNFYQNSVSDVVPALTYTIAPEGVVASIAPSLSVNWYATGLGGLIDYSINASTSSAISLPANLAAGETYELTTSLSDIETAIFGGIALTVSAPGGVGTLTLPDWMRGEEWPLNIGQSYDVVLTDISNETVTFSRTHSLKPNYTRNILGDGATLSIAANSLGKAARLVEDSEIFVPDLDGGTIANSGLQTNVAFGKNQNFWHRDLNNIMWKFAVRNTEA